MFYITGDTHGDFTRVFNYARSHDLDENDTVIVLGDAGINYYLNGSDTKLKEKLSKLEPTIFSIHGNHEARPETLFYLEKEWNGGVVYYEDAFPNLLFAKDGEVYDFDGAKTVAIGGAYSVDKSYRVSRGAQWFPDEQPSEEIKERVEAALSREQWQVDVVLSHTTPYQMQPFEVFLPFIDQDAVDKSTEEWLTEIEKRLDYKKWYAGHFHVDKTVGNFQLMFEGIEPFLS